MENPAFEYISKVNYPKIRREIEIELNQIHLIGNEPKDTSRWTLADTELEHHINWILQKIEDTEVFPTSGSVGLREQFFFSACGGIKDLQKYLQKYPQLIRNINLVFADHLMKIIVYSVNFLDQSKDTYKLFEFIVFLEKAIPHFDTLLSLELEPEFKKEIEHKKLVLTILKANIFKILEPLRKK